MFVLGRPFQPRVIYLKAWSRGEHLTGGKVRLEWLHVNNFSSSFGTYVNYKEKSFITLTPVVNVIILFTTVSYTFS